MLLKFKNILAFLFSTLFWIGASSATTITGYQTLPPGTFPSNSYLGIALIHQSAPTATPEVYSFWYGLSNPTPLITFAFDWSTWPLNPGAVNVSPPKPDLSTAPSPLSLKINFSIKNIPTTGRTFWELIRLEQGADGISTLPRTLTTEITGGRLYPAKAPVALDWGAPLQDPSEWGRYVVVPPLSTATPVPEPATFALMGFGLACVSLAVKRQRYPR